jgi:RNA binding activity-knot of a chromodomain
VRLTPTGEDDYTIEPQKLPVPQAPQVVSTTLENGEEKKDIVMVDVQPTVPLNLHFDYYVHYVGHQRRNDRWCS